MIMRAPPAVFDDDQEEGTSLFLPQLAHRERLSYGHHGEGTMPFAGEFRSGMRLPHDGDAFGAFVVESVQVEHVGAAPGRYEYPLEIVVRGKGGKDGARKALKPVLDRRATIFSEFGNPYQCGIGTVKVESLGESRYRLRARGVGTRIHLRTELARFMDHLAAKGCLSGASTAGPDARRDVVAGYLAAYQASAEPAFAARRSPPAGDRPAEPIP
jgi:hypothetical protein